MTICQRSSRDASRFHRRARLFRHGAAIAFLIGLAANSSLQAQTIGTDESRTTAPSAPTAGRADALNDLPAVRAECYRELFEIGNRFRERVDGALVGLRSTRDSLAANEQLIAAVIAKDSARVAAVLAPHAGILRDAELMLYDGHGVPIAAANVDDHGAIAIKDFSSGATEHDCRSETIADALVRSAQPFMTFVTACEFERARFTGEYVLLAARQLKDSNGVPVGLLTLVQGTQEIATILAQSHADAQGVYDTSILSWSGESLDNALLSGSGNSTIPARLLPPPDVRSALANAALLGEQGVYLGDDSLEMFIHPLPALRSPQGRQPSLLVCADARDIQSRANATVVESTPSTLRLVILVLFSLALAVGIFLVSRRRLLRASEEVRAAAAETVLERNRLISGVSHDIRGPLGAIMGYADLLQSSPMYRDDVSLRESAFDAIKRSCDFILRLTDHLLDLRSATMGRLSLESRFTDVLAICDACVNLYALEASGKDVSLMFAHPGIDRLQILGDPTRVRQIVQNLVGNAVRYTDHGSVTLALWIPDDARNEIEISVSDTGIGISPEGQAKIFEPFYRERRPERGSRTGTGLGLAVVKTIVEALGGRIEVQSELGKGSTFVVRIPAPAWVDPDQSAPLRSAVAAIDASANASVSSSASAFSSEAPTTEGTLAGTSIAFADDYADAREITSILLRSAGASVSAFASGTDLAHAMQCGLHADCVLLDLQMPGLSGHETAMLLRKGGYTGPLVALSALSDDATRKRSFECGFAEHLRKPGDPAHVQQVLAALIAKSRERAKPDHG